MANFPLFSRLSLREYLALILGFLFIATESLLRLIILFLPKQIIAWFYDRSRSLFHSLTPARARTRVASTAHPHNRTSPYALRADRIRKARDFEELCDIYGYIHEEHVVLTKDGYLLGLHRLPSKKGHRRDSPGTSTGKPVVYLHHGLLMNSEVWVCLTDASRCIPFVLAEHGFDVWLGNNRGNKYSKKSIHYAPSSTKFWDFSIDDYAWHDIPDSIHYILDTTRAHSLSYIGFSQGTAQAFAALSIHPQLNEKVNVFIALAPAMSPAGLAAPIVDGLMKASPTLVFLFFGRKSMFSSVIFWQQILFPPIFTSVIDAALAFLFAWSSTNISPTQKLAAYAHLYSPASVKAVVHWFQIMRASAFLMYDDDIPLLAPARPAPAPASAAYRPARFPTRNIVTPIVLLYGAQDSLVDIAAMRRELPRHIVEKRLEGYEHLDVLWGRDVQRDVIPEVLAALRKFCLHPDMVGVKVLLDGTDGEGSTDWGSTD